MQDWQNHKRVSEVYLENTKIFTHSKGQQLDLIHEVGTPEKARSAAAQLVSAIKTR
jgi:ClpP class serine protease